LQMNGESRTKSGWPDWANLRQNGLPMYILWTFFKNNLSVTDFCYFFHRSSYIFILAKYVWVWLHFWRLFFKKCPGCLHQSGPLLMWPRSALSKSKRKK
jgi:hypothetical protein